MKEHELGKAGPPAFDVEFHPAAEKGILLFEDREVGYRRMQGAAEKRFKSLGKK